MQENQKTRMLSLGFLGKIKNVNIRFNPRPFSNPDAGSGKVNTKNDSFVDLHLEVARKVDALISQNESEEEETSKMTRPSWFQKDIKTNDTSLLK